MHASWPAFADRLRVGLQQIFCRHVTLDGFSWPTARPEQL
jgi:hypothetical protein